MMCSSAQLLMAEHVGAAGGSSGGGATAPPGAPLLGMID